MPTHRAMVRMSRSSSTCVIAIPSCSSSWRWGRLQTIDNLDMTTHFLVSLRLQSTQIIQKLIPVGQREYARPEIQFLPRRSEEHTSELQSLMRISYAVFCLKK